MKRGTRMQPVDSAGLPNIPGGRRRLALCPTCGDTPATRGGVTWKWVAIHLAEHLGFSWGPNGWASIQQADASNGVIPQSITTTHDDE